jgi:hypothetical protein
MSNNTHFAVNAHQSNKAYLVWGVVALCGCRLHNNTEGWVEWVLSSSWGGSYVAHTTWERTPLVFGRLTMLKTVPPVHLLTKCSKMKEGTDHQLRV